MILLLTPLQIETEALLRGIEAVTVKARPESMGPVRLFCHGDQFVQATGGHGKVQFAVTTSYLCEKLKPELVMCLGTCGALTADLKPRDVVVAEKTIEHDFTLRFLKKPLPEFGADKATLARLKRAVPELSGAHDLNFAVHFGSIASGDEDIMDSVRAKSLHAATSALAVAWEGAGGARAARFYNVPFLEMRTVTDSASAHSVDEFRKHCAGGMANLATLLLNTFA